LSNSLVRSSVVGDLICDGEFRFARQDYLETRIASEAHSFTNSIEFLPTSICNDKAIVLRIPTAKVHE
jgi:hypothetical protein